MTDPTEPRRVRTQAERDADAADKGHAFHPGGAVSGEPVRIHLHPDECFVRPAGGGFVCVRVTHRPPPMTADCGNPPRRRWWHRLTRALAGRWLHVLTPGFLGELSNDIWSHTRHRLTRRNP